MRKLVIVLMLAGIATGQAQVIQLDETRVNSKGVLVSSVGGGLNYHVVENYSNRFVKNPIAFMKENFDIKPFIKQMDGERNDSFRVEFRSQKGAFVAYFNRQGTLLSTTQRFKNIPLSSAISQQLVNEHKGWAMTKNLYMASGKGDLLDRELFKITLKNGNDMKRVKIIPNRSLQDLVSN